MSNLSYEGPLIKVAALTKVYSRAGGSVSVLNNLNLEVARGEFLAVMGASGSGKSTLLHILGCLGSQSTGNYWLDGVEVTQIEEIAQSAIRSEKIGFIFQKFYLLPQLSVKQNVALPFLYSSQSVEDMQERVREVLRRVGLLHRLHHRPSELSGGEIQRVAIARALVKRPQLILADEPTGNLDEKSGRDILELFAELRSEGATIVIVTHDAAVAALADRVLQLREGCFAS